MQWQSPKKILTADDWKKNEQICNQNKTGIFT